MSNWLLMIYVHHFSIHLLDAASAGWRLLLICRFERAYPTVHKPPKVKIEAHR